MFYHFPDPTNTSDTWANADGALAGHLLYDATGCVLKNTLTAELSAALAGQSALADPATGLIHLGGGRYYDPALGRPLQPNPAGGVTLADA